MPEISVIVPVYNVEKYLHKCLNSILEQTFSNFELLLIDDGSPDNSGKICDEYAKKDRRIRVFHKENEGVSKARNLGLNNVEGKWIAFIDSDDWIDDKYFEHLLANDNNNIDLRVIGYKKYSRILCEEYIPKEELLSEDLQSFLNDHIGSTIIAGPVCKLFLKRIIKKNNLCFDNELSLGEDTLFSLSYLRFTKSVYISAHSEYHYRYSDDSLTKKPNIDDWITFLTKYKSHQLFLIEKYKRLNSIKIDWWNKCIGTISRLYYFKIYKKQKRYDYLQQIYSLLNTNKDFNYYPFIISKKYLVIYFTYKYIKNIYLSDFILNFILKLR